MKLLLGLWTIIASLTLSEASLNVRRELSDVQPASDEIVSRHVAYALTIVPEWLSEYAEWHKQKRKTNFTNDPATKFLVVACHKNRKCGGVVDRLKALPYFLLIAKETNRMLFIKWEKFDLEEFLVPPDGGIDWRLPEDIDIGEKPDITGSADSDELENFFNDPRDKHHTQRIVVAQSNSDYYGKNRHYFKTQKNPDGTYRQIMRLLFRPSHPVNVSMKRTMSRLGLKPKKYVAAHYRAADVTYISHEVDVPETYEISDEERSVVSNAINCAVKGGGGENLPVYFTSSNTKYVKYAMHDSEFARVGSQIRVTGIDDVVRFHSDKPHKYYNYSQADPRDLYPVFVDLLIMGESKCVSRGRLGFGGFGARMADESCHMLHSQRLCPDAMKIRFE